jgi:formamidopyrimidine-DNA glycosylase
MIEIPEAFILAAQTEQSLIGKQVSTVITLHSPHKFAWFSGDPQRYKEYLSGKVITGSEARAGQLEIILENYSLVFSDGVNLRFHPDDTGIPEKHQLLVKFQDKTALSASIAMYGGILCSPIGNIDNPYYLAARNKPSPLTSTFNLPYFTTLFRTASQKLSLKAFLATEQRIPGLGNGVLQDILFHAGDHPKRKLADLGESEIQKLFQAIKTTLSDMAESGGRDTENDLFGKPGRYITQMSKNTVGKPCPNCGQTIQKEAYLGGSIYYCSSCQKL